MADYGMEDLVDELNHGGGGACARSRRTDAMTEKTPEQAAFRRRRGRADQQDLSLSPDVNDPQLPGDARRGQGSLPPARSRRWFEGPRCPTSVLIETDLRHPQRQGRAIFAVWDVFDQIGEACRLDDLRPITDLSGPAPCAGQTTGGVLELPVRARRNRSRSGPETAPSGAEELRDLVAELFAGPRLRMWPTPMRPARRVRQRYEPEPWRN